MKPELDLFAEDGSIFLNEKVEVVSPNIGLIEYKLPERIIKHAGKMNCKLFLKTKHNQYMSLTSILKFSIVA